MTGFDPERVLALRSWSQGRYSKSSSSHKNYGRSGAGKEPVVLEGQQIFCVISLKYYFPKLSFL